MIQIKNRLPELKKLHNTPDIEGHFESDEDESETVGDNRIYNGPIGSVLKKYLCINKHLNDIKCHLITMKTMTTAEHFKDFKQKEFDKIRSDCIKIGHDIVKKFKRLESRLPLSNDFTTLARIKRLLYYGFFQQYIIIWTENEQFLMEFEQKLKKKLQVQSQILNCNLTDEDIATLIDNKNTNLFMSNILQDAENEREKLRDIQDRFKDIKRLEKTITEVHNLFISLQTLVTEQGDSIQRIETHFNTARDYLHEANNHIQMVQQMKKRGCCQFIKCF